ncbi:hypothetical protein [Telluribacter humicola]|uniref:hypothetical protein n=1 Tax=Telluribacter humicola TaxID=1720261 RepID=UPI001A976A16|nr:hypothetical protein [Telluribacter humicola]
MTVTDTKNASPDLPNWANISIYILLLIILAVFGDLLVFIVGFLGITIAFASYYSGRTSEHELHDSDHTLH